MAAFSKNVTPADKVCNTCGDIGYPEIIATCYKCNKNSAHIYCMQNPPGGVVAKYWQCDDCITKSNGKLEKRKTILLDDMEAKKATTLLKRRSFLTKDSKQFNGSRRQPPSARHGSSTITDASTSKGRETIPVSCSSSGVFSNPTISAPVSCPTLRVLSTPTFAKNIRLTTMSRATHRMPVSLVSRAPATHSQGTNKASEQSVTQSILTTQTENIGSEAPNAHCRGTNIAREPSVGQGVLTTQTENIGYRAPNTHPQQTSRASKPLGITARARSQIGMNGYHNANPEPKLLLTTAGLPPHHPVPNACWMGDFKIFDLTSNMSREIQGIHAHIPSIVSLNVYETMKRLRGQDIKLELLPRLDIWPALFDLGPPHLGDIGLFFFPSEEQRLKEKYTHFVNMMDKKGLAMKGHLSDANLLIFTSSQLPSDYNGIVHEVCVWGVLHRMRPKKRSAPGQEELAANSSIAGNGRTNGDKNHGARSSSRSRSEVMANVRKNLLNAPIGFSEPIFRNRTQRERPSITYSPVLFRRDDRDAAPHGFSKPICRPKRN